MSREKKSFFERLTGTINMAAEDSFDDDRKEVAVDTSGDNNWPEEPAEVGELAVDVYQTAENIFVKTMVAGVKPEDLDVAIGRDMVTISGHREEARTAGDEDYQVRELYWGEFSRTVALPAEVEPDEAEAYEKHGLLVIRLPKVDKDKKTKLRIKSS